jgi:hypothetical protein
MRSEVRSRRVPSTIIPTVRRQIATMNYVRKTTKVPVPQVILYDGDLDGRVGGEWMVEEYVCDLTATSRFSF